MKQLSLFETTDVPPVTYWPNFLHKEQVDSLLQHCLSYSWQQNKIKMLGKILPIPRLEAIHGDEGCDYIYSGQIKLQPQPWTEELRTIRFAIEKLTTYKFNIVIGNLYRNGQDSIGWHSDSEPSMGIFPAIASLSLGATRKFQIRKKTGGEITNYWLEHGSLLVMHPGCQESWKHQVPKTNSPVGQRVNLTFRPHIKSTT